MKLKVGTWRGEEKPERGGVTQPGVSLDDKEEREVRGFGGESSMKLPCSLLYWDTEWPKVPGQWESE